MHRSSSHRGTKTTGLGSMQGETRYHLIVLVLVALVFELVAFGLVFVTGVALVAFGLVFVTGVALVAFGLVFVTGVALVAFGLVFVALVAQSCHTT
jgi:hypothetical protein